jgi:hypothetical protein
MVVSAWRWTSASSLASRITRFEIIEPLWSVLETKVRNKFPPPTSLEDVLQEERYKIPLETVQNLYEPILRRTAAVLKAKGDPTPY